MELESDIRVLKGEDTEFRSIFLGVYMRCVQFNFLVTNICDNSKFEKNKIESFF